MAGDLAYYPMTNKNATAKSFSDSGFALSQQNQSIRMSSSQVPYTYQSSQVSALFKSLII